MVNELEKRSTLQLVEEHRHLNRMIDKRNRSIDLMLPAARDELQGQKRVRCALKNELIVRAAACDQTALDYLSNVTTTHHRSVAA